MCDQLGFSSGTAKAVLRQVTDMIELNNERNQMIVSMGDIAQVFVKKRFVKHLKSLILLEL